MPIVPTYGPRKVTTAPLPGVRKQAHETALSEGAGLASAEAQRSEAMGNFGGVAANVGAQLWEQETRRADEVAMLEAQNKLAKWENDRIYNPETGALTVKGKDAMPLAGQVGQEFDQVAGEIEQGLTNPRQREAFRRIKGQRAISLDATLKRHTFGEMQRYEGQELQALVENAQTTAVANANDPRRVGEELSRAVGAIKAHAPRLGLGPEQVQEQVTKIQTATHEGVINRLLVEDKSKAAQAYFAEAKDSGQITGDALVRIEKALETGGLRSDSQKFADQILADPKLDTLTKQQDKAKELASDRPELRDALNQRLEHAAALKERTDRDREEATLTDAFNVLDSTHDVTKISPAVWSNLPGNARASLRAYADHLARGVPVQTDLPTYYTLMQQAADDPEGFMTQNLLTFRGKLDEGEFKQFAQMQTSMRTGNRKAADKDLGAYRTKTELLDDTLTQYGIDPKAKFDTAQGKAVAQLRRMLDVRMQDFGDVTGKKPTNKDIQDTLDDLLSKQTTTPGSWWNLYQWTGTKRAIDTTIEDVPARERSLIEDALRRRGRPVSDATVLDLFMTTKARGQ